MTLDDIVAAIGIEPYYRDKWAVIYHADCRDILPLIPDKSVDLVLTDPPYGVGVDYGNGKAADNHADWHDVLDESRRIGRIIAWSPGTKNMVDWIIQTQPKWIGAWLKPNQCSRSPLGFGAWEPIMFYWNNGDLKEYQHLGQDAWYDPIATQGGHIGQHPCPKSASFWIKLIAKDSNIILDPFLGSGTTTFCAKKLNRYSIGIEIEEKYCKIAADRLRQSVMELNI